MNTESGCILLSLWFWLHFLGSACMVVFWGLGTDSRVRFSGCNSGSPEIRYSPESPKTGCSPEGPGAALQLGVARVPATKNSPRDPEARYSSWGS